MGDLSNGGVLIADEDGRPLDMYMTKSRRMDSGNDVKDVRAIHAKVSVLQDGQKYGSRRQRGTIGAATAASLVNWMDVTTASSRRMFCHETHPRPT